MARGPKWDVGATSHKGKQEETWTRAPLSFLWAAVGTKLRIHWCELALGQLWTVPTYMGAVPAFLRASGLVALDMEDMSQEVAELVLLPVKNAPK